MLSDIALTLFLVLLNGFFVSAEFALVKVRISQLELKIRSGSRLASLAKSLVMNLDSYLSATQVGITLASLGLGWIGESVVARVILGIFYTFNIPLSEHVAHNIALPVAFITITVLHIVLGEQAPKIMAIQKPEQLALSISLPLRAFYIVFNPFIKALNWLANTFVKLIGFEPRNGENFHSPDEIRYLLEESTKSGAFDVQEHELLENVFDFADIPVRQIMVPRGRIIGVEISMPSREILNRFIDEGYSRMPVYEREIDNIIGVIYAKDLISLMCHQNLILIQDIIRPAYFIQEDEKINTLLREMQRQRIHLAIVLDEFGGTGGLVTMEDIIEEIVGEIQDEYDEETPIVEPAGPKEFLVDASAIIGDVNDFLPVPLPEDEDYDTVGGLIISTIGRIPEENEKIELENYNCLIVKSNERYIEQVKLIYIEKAEE